MSEQHKICGLPTPCGLSVLSSARTSFRAGVGLRVRLDVRSERRRTPRQQLAPVPLFGHPAMFFIGVTVPWSQGLFHEVLQRGCNDHLEVGESARTLKCNPSATLLSLVKRISCWKRRAHVGRKEAAASHLQVLYSRQDLRVPARIGCASRLEDYGTQNSTMPRKFPN